MSRFAPRAALRGRGIIKQRILTAAVALPLLILFLLYAGTAMFGVFVGAVAVLGLYEYYAMSLPAQRRCERLLAAALGAVLVFLLASRNPELALACLASSVLLFGSVFLLRFEDLKTVMQQLSLLLFGILYLPLLLGHLPLLRGLPLGREWIFLVLIIIMSGDTAAYFTGVSLGRRKLYPAISPNKSIEGAIGGLVGSAVGALLARFSFFPALTLADCLFLGLFLGVLGQMGDLFESMLKRACGVKDSGTIIPGHGGILDRLDSLLFAFPPAYYYALLRFGAGGAS